MKTVKRRTLVALTTALALILVPATLAVAGQNDVVRRGTCTDASHWKLKVSPDDRRLEVEFQVDQNASGDRWRVRIRHDGHIAFRGTRTTRTTRSPSGSFEVRIRERNHSGPDRFRARARNLSTDEVCLGRASY